MVPSVPALTGGDNITRTKAKTIKGILALRRDNYAEERSSGTNGLVDTGRSSKGACRRNAGRAPCPDRRRIRPDDDQGGNDALDADRAGRSLREVRQVRG